MAEMGGSGDEEQRLSLAGKALKEGERILGPTRRPDGTLRKPVRIRAGYVPQDEVAIYQPKGALLKKGAIQEVPPGYDPVLDAKPKTKAAKRNEKKKEKRHQAALASEKGKDKDEMENGEVEVAQNARTATEAVESIEHEMNNLTVSETPNVADTCLNSKGLSNSGNTIPDIDKKIRALKKKVRITEALQKEGSDSLKPEQLEKLSKLDVWREELRLLENQKATLVS